MALIGNFSTINGHKRATIAQLPANRCGSPAAIDCSTSHKPPPTPPSPRSASRAHSTGSVMSSILAGPVPPRIPLRSMVTVTY